MNTKRFISFVLSICTIFSLAACGKNESFSLKESRSPAPSVNTSPTLSAPPVSTASPAPSATASVPPAPTPSGDDSTTKKETVHFIANYKTKRYHLPKCSYLPEGKNRRYYDTPEEAERQGYIPCGKCLPQ